MYHTECGSAFSIPFRPILRKSKISFLPLRNKIKAENTKTQRSRYFSRSALSRQKRRSKQIALDREFSAARTAHRKVTTAQCSLKLTGAQCAPRVVYSRSVLTALRPPPTIALSSHYGLLGGAQCSLRVAQRPYRCSHSTAQCMLTLTDAPAIFGAKRSVLNMFLSAALSA